MADVREELALDAVGGQRVVTGVRELPGTLQHLVLQPESQAVELIVDATEAKRKGHAHRHDHCAEAEGSHREVEWPVKAEDVPGQLAGFDDDHDHASHRDDPRFRVPEPDLLHHAYGHHGQKRQEPQPAHGAAGDDWVHVGP